MHSKSTLITGSSLENDQRFGRRLKLCIDLHSRRALENYRFESYREFVDL